MIIFQEQSHYFQRIRNKKCEHEENQRMASDAQQEVSDLEPVLMC